MDLKIGIINKMIKKNIIVTGGNKGIGFGLVKKLSKDHNVIFTVRSEAKGNQIGLFIDFQATLYRVSDFSCEK